MTSESTRRSASGWQDFPAMARHPRLSPRTRARRPFRRAVLVAVALIGGTVAPAIAQSPLSEDGGRVVRDDAQLRTSEPDAQARRSLDAVAPDTGARFGMRSWQARPDFFATSPRGDWPAEGRPLPGLDGSVCWPHGDHFHCR